MEQMLLEQVLVMLVTIMLVVMEYLLLVGLLVRLMESQQFNMGKHLLEFMLLE
jgi:hypothetical protein